MKLYRELVQGSEDWKKTRFLHLSASKAQAIASNGKGLESLCIELLTAVYSSERDNFSNEDTERGNELEPVARNIYELTTGNKVEQVGFVEIDEHLGFSPDGLIGENGGLEIKCLNDTNHMKAILYGLKGVDKKYWWQCQMSLLLSKREYWDIALFNPHFEKSLLIFRIEPDEEAFEKLEKGIEKGKNLLNELQEKYGKAIY